MADSTSDVSKMKVIELKKELKSRGLTTTGDKSELVSRLQTALAKDASSEHALDSDELDSDEVLEDDDDDKNGTDIINEDLISDVSLATSTTSGAQVVSEETKPSPTPAPRTLKRKPPPIVTSTEIISEDKLLSPDEPSPPKIKITGPDNTPVPEKKISLNRAPVTALIETEKPENADSEQTKATKMSMDPSERLKMRAQRFGLPLVGSAAKVARAARFGLGSTNSTSAPSSNIHKEKTASLDVLKKRAERFGTSVSKTMEDEENKAKLEKRKAKFGGAVIV